MSAALSAALVEDGAALEALAPDWWRLWRRCSSASPFQSPAWLVPWWQAFGPGRLATIALYEGDTCVALAPLYLEHGPLGCRLLPLGIGITDQLDVLVDPAVPGAGAALIRAIHDLAPDWETFELDELTAGASGLALPGLPGAPDSVTDQSASPVLDLNGSEPIPRGKRRKLRMAINRVARRGGEVAGVEPEEVPDFLGHLVRLHGARWDRRGQDGVLAEDDVRRFHALALTQLVAAGLARLAMLRIQGRVVGAYYGLHRGSRAFAYLGGFDPDFSFESPGTVLLGWAIEAARAEGASEFHFLRGQEPYKYEWGATDSWTRRRSFRRSGHG